MWCLFLSVEELQQNTTPTSKKKWLKRLGVAGFLFFLIKGIAWIVVSIFAWKGCAG